MGSSEIYWESGTIYIQNLHESHSSWEDVTYVFQRIPCHCFHSPGSILVVTRGRSVLPLRPRSILQELCVDQRLIQIDGRPTSISGA